MKKLILLLLCLMLAGCGSSQAPSEKLQVAASFYPMAELTQAIGGSRVHVTTLVPDGAEAHDWEPAPRDLTKLGRAQVFVYNGIVEPWAEPALEALAERKIVAVEAGAGLFEREGKQDPHVWISPKKALIQAERICTALQQVDAQHAAEYEANYKELAGKLQVLDKELAEVAATAPKRVFITAHAAFGHLAADYGLRQLAIAGISPEAEPSPGDLHKLVNLVKREQVSYIFFETLGDPRIAQMLANETGAKVSILDPLEGVTADGRKQGLNYIKLQEQNIRNLARALND